MKEDFAILSEEFPPVLEKVKNILAEIETLEKAMDKAAIPWTPGRLPVLQP